MADAALREVVTEVRDNMLISWDVPIPMSDGTILRSDIFRPADANLCPVIMSHGCYAKGLSFQKAYAAQWERMAQDFPGDNPGHQRQIPVLGGRRPGALGSRRLCRDTGRLTRVGPVRRRARRMVHARDLGLLRMHRVGRRAALE